uniref:Uncharacterized protein n=1 Tax=Timema poppense TaxID=170557 RepID=A0A7R9H6M4_TIMPO|nr:unnamed protein product [Timema poppensis]
MRLSESPQASPTCIFSVPQGLTAKCAVTCFGARKVYSIVIRALSSPSSAFQSIECKQEAIMVFGLGSQLRPCLRVSAFIICLMVVSMFYILNFGNSSNLLHQVVIVAAEKNSSLNMCGTVWDARKAKDGYLVWTPSCQIPEIDPYDPSIKKMLRRSDPIICSKHGPLTYVTTRGNSTSSYSLMIDSEMISKYVPPHQKLFCCYSIVTRVTVSTENYNSSADNFYKTLPKLHHKKLSTRRSHNEIMMIVIMKPSAFGRYRATVMSDKQTLHFINTESHKLFQFKAENLNLHHFEVN